MAATTEYDFLQRMLPQLEAEGYEVYLRPDSKFLPAFLQGYRPSAIALRHDKNLAIEVSRRSGPRTDRIDSVSKLFKDQPRWELRIVWLDPATHIGALPLQSASTVKAQVVEMRQLIDGGHLSASLLLGWATLEAGRRDGSVWAPANVITIA
jgi:hypothetical protein